MKERKLIRTRVIYDITIVISVLLILFSYIPYGIKGAEVLLQGIGCSGLTAGIMAIFIEFAQQKQQEQKNVELRQYYLSNLNSQLKHLFERLIWFDYVINFHELDRDSKYYQSLDFAAEAHSWNYYRVENPEHIEVEINDIIRKYDMTKWEDSQNLNVDKVERMFDIIGCASNGLQIEVDILLRNRMYLLVNDIFSKEELGKLSTYLGNHVQFLQAKNTNYSTALLFLFDAYKMVRKMGNFQEDDMYITWQLPENMMKMVLEKRKHLGESQ